MRETQFESFLQDDLSWRKKEISDLFMLSQTQSGEAQKILLKSLILVLYSHWEGYIKKSSKLYLKFISEEKIKLIDLTVNFKGIHLKNLSKDCIDNNESASLGKEIEFITKYKSVENIKFKINVNPDDDREQCIVETGHNLKPKVFKNILTLLGLEYFQPLSAREQYLSSNLLDNRNAISHGSKFLEDAPQDFSLRIDDIRKLKEIIMVILDVFQEILLDYQSNRYYLLINEEAKLRYDADKAERLHTLLEDIEKD